MTRAVALPPVSRISAATARHSSILRDETTTPAFGIRLSLPTSPRPIGCARWCFPAWPSEAQVRSSLSPRSFPWADTAGPGIRGARLGQSTIECAPSIWDLFRGKHWGQRRSAAQTGRTRDRTRLALLHRQNALAKAPSTRGPRRTWDYWATAAPSGCRLRRQKRDRLSALLLDAAWEVVQPVFDARDESWQRTSFLYKLPFFRTAFPYVAAAVGLGVGAGLLIRWLA